MPERDPLRSALAPVAVCAIALSGLAAMFWPMVEDPESLRFFGISDAWIYTGAGQSFVDQTIHGGEFPFWNPLVFCGQPLAGNPQYLLFYPPNLLRSVLTVEPTPWRTMIGFGILAVAHAVFAALGGYAFARFHDYTRAGAAVAGITFVFSSALMQRFFLHHHIFFVVAWLPWNLLAIDWAGCANSGTQAVRRYVLLGSVFAMTILAGSPELTYFVAIAMVFYWLLRTIERITREFRIGWIRRDIGGGIIAVLVAIGLASALIVPAIEFIEGTQRLGPDAERIELDPSRESANLREALLFYPGRALEGIKGIGASASILCVLGLFSRLRREAILLAVLAAVLVSASRVNSPIMLHAIGAWAPFPISSPGRLSLIAAFPLAMLAGLGVDRLLEPFRSRLARIGAVGVCLALTLLVFETLYSYSLSTVRFGGVPVIWSLTFPFAAAVASAAAIVVPAWRWCVAVAVCAAIGEPLFWQSVKIHGLMGREGAFASISSDTAHQRPVMWAGNSRDSLLEPNSSLYTLRGQMNGYDPLHLRGYAELIAPENDDPFWRGNVEAGRWRDRPYLLMKRAFWLHRGYVAGEIPPRGHLFPVSTTAYVTDPGPLDAPILAADEVATHPYSRYVVRFPILTEPMILESAGALDGPVQTLAVPAQASAIHPVLRVVVSSTTPAILDIRLPEKTLRGAAQMVASIELSEALVRAEYDIPLPDADFGQIEFLSVFPSSSGTITIETAEIVFDQADENWRIRSIQRRANSVELEVADLDDYRILSFIDFSYRGWHAYIDGEPVELLKTFSYFKGVEVPPGTHQVRFEFRPLIAYAGIALSFLSIVIVAFLIVWTFAVERGQRTVDAGDDPAP